MPGSQDSRPYSAIDSPVESARFGRRVRRYEITGNDAGPLLAALRAEQPDLAIVRIPTSLGACIADLCALGGQFVLGDCRVIYARGNIDAGRTRGPRNVGFRMREATAADAPLLDSLVERIFEGYHTHYVSNPRLAAFALADGYKEWTRAHIGGREKRCLIAELEGEPCAFTTVHVTSAVGEVVLNGVLPQFRGRGVYRDLLRATVDVFVEADARSTIIATQIDNRAVQRVWVTEDFELVKSEYTIHINFGG
jgi:GNAT superfamily N-acetyltransferase